MGFNFCGPGSPNAIYDYALAMRAKGAKTGPFVVTNEGKAIYGLASIDASILTVFRVKGAGRGEPDPRNYEGRSWTGEEWVAHWLPELLPGIRPNGYLGFKNEVFNAEFIDWYVKFDKEMIDACDKRGIKCTYGNFSVGSFRSEHIRKLAPLVDYGHGHGHLLSLNAYVDDGNPGLFWFFKSLLDSCPTAYWILGEVGWYADDARYRGPVALKALLAEHGKIRHAGYRGGALWCENGAGGGWEHSDIGGDWRVVIP